MLSTRLLTVTNRSLDAMRQADPKATDILSVTFVSLSMIAYDAMFRMEFADILPEAA